MAEKIYQATSDGSLQEVSLPEFVCHKVVRAAKIVAVGIGPEVPPDAPHGTRRGVRLALEGAAHVDVSQLWMQTKAAQPGGYFVQYEDGYSSFSPAKAFEEGYVKAEADGEKKRPTIEELEAILAENDDQIATKINADGSITAYPKDTAQISALSAAIGMKTVELPAAPSAADLDAINADPATAGATGTNLLEFAKMPGDIRAADPAEPKPTEPMPRDIPEGSFVTVKGGRGIQFKVKHCEQINGRRFVALDGLPQLFHESELIPVAPVAEPAAEEPDTHAEEIADFENNHGEPPIDPGPFANAHVDPTPGDDSEATDQTSSSEPEPSSTQPTNSDSSTESSGTQNQDASSSQDQTGTMDAQPTEESPEQATQAEPQPEQPAAADPNAAAQQTDQAE